MPKNLWKHAVPFSYGTMPLFKTSVPQTSTLTQPCSACSHVNAVSWNTCILLVLILRQTVFRCDSKKVWLTIRIGAREKTLVISSRHVRTVSISASLNCGTVAPSTAALPSGFFSELADFGVVFRTLKLWETFMKKLLVLLKNNNPKQWDRAKQTV